MFFTALRERLNRRGEITLERAGDRVFGDRLFWICRKFRKDRASFYSNLALRKQAMPQASFAEFFEEDAERFKGEARGVLSAHWLSKIEGTDGQDQVVFLSEVLAGTVPSEDISVLAVSEYAGDVSDGLLALADSVKKLDQVKRSIIMIFSSIIGALLIMHVNVFIFGFLQMPAIEGAMSGLLSVKDFGPLATFAHYVALAIRYGGWLFVLGEIALVIWLVKTLPTYVGSLRPFLDRHVLPYQYFRIFHGYQFITSLSVVTRKVGNAMLNLTEGLEIMRDNAFPWLRRHVDRVLYNLEETPDAGGMVFDTGLFDRRTIHWIYDLSKHQPDLSTRLKTLTTVMLEEAAPALERTARRISGYTTVVLIAFILIAYFYPTLVTNELTKLYKLHAITGQ